MAAEDPSTPSDERTVYRLAVYDGAPAETVSPKHWTDLPKEDREKHLAANPRLRHFISASFSMGIALCLLLLAYPYQDNDRSDAKALIGAGIGLILGTVELFHAWRVGKRTETKLP